MTEIPLNLVFTYPVRWSRFKVLRDLVQNFYDAIGRRAWSRRFNWARDGDALVLEARGVGFSYEWLLHIGASTKTSAARGKYAGFFGEGFKIAALCAHRDHGWHISMESRDWELFVDSARILIDGEVLRSLCYRVRRRPATDVTRLRLSPFSLVDESLLEAVLLSFYHAENPLFGECIWKDDNTAFFLRSGRPKPRGFPETDRDGGPGIVFAGLQAIGSFEFPLVIAKHDLSPRSRERETFYRMDVVNTIHAASRCLPAVAAAVVLEKLRRRWYEYPSRRYDFDSFHPIVRTLAQRVASGAEERERWLKAHPNLLVARRVRRSDLPAANRRKQALAWLGHLSPRPRLVQDGFLSLGYPDLETACEEAGGFISLHEPDPIEQRYVAVLNEVVLAVYPGILPKEGPPPLRIIVNASAAWKGMADHLRAPAGERTAGGDRIRYRQTQVALDGRLLAPDRFGDALAHARSLKGRMTPSSPSCAERSRHTGA